MTRQRLLLVAVLFGGPVLAFTISTGLEYRINGNVRRDIMRAYPKADARKINGLILSTLCSRADGRGANRDLCATSDHLEWMRCGGVGSAIAALILLGVIRLAGFLTMKNRDLILRVFDPCLRLTMIGAAILAPVNSALLIASIWYGSVYFLGFIGTIHIVIMGSLALGGVLAASTGVRACVSTLKSSAKAHIFGRNLAPQDAGDLWTLVRRLAEKAGTAPPQNIVLGLEPNFFVTESEMDCLNASLRGRTLFISLPMCRLLTEGELSAVIGHELGHFVGHDTEYSTKFFPIYRQAGLAAANMHGSSGKGTLGALPALLIIGYFLESFATAVNEINRDRELIADELGAALSDPKSFASALIKLHAFSPLWKDVDERMRDGAVGGLPLENMGAYFSEKVAVATKSDVLSGLLEKRLVHPTNSHPPLSERLDHLKLSLDSVRAEALVVSPVPAAASLIPGANALECELSDSRLAVVKRGYFCREV